MPVFLFFKAQFLQNQPFLTRQKDGWRLFGRRPCVHPAPSTHSRPFKMWVEATLRALQTEANKTERPESGQSVGSRAWWRNGKTHSIYPCSLWPHCGENGWKVWSMYDPWNQSEATLGFSKHNKHRWCFVFDTKGPVQSIMVVSGAGVDDHAHDGWVWAVPLLFRWHPPWLVMNFHWLLWTSQKVLFLSRYFWKRWRQSVFLSGLDLPNQPHVSNRMQLGHFLSQTGICVALVFFRASYDDVPGV